MSSDCFDVRVKSVRGTEVIFDVLTGTAAGYDDPCASRSFALKLLADALRRAVSSVPGEWSDPKRKLEVNRLYEAHERRSRGYVGLHRSASGASYKVRVTPPDPPGPRIQGARAIVAWVDANLDAIGRAVADELWPTWDGSWRQDDEDDIDREAFERRLSLYSVSWDEEQSEGDFSLSFDDGGLFGNHGIAVAVEGFAVRSAELFG